MTPNDIIKMIKNGGNPQQVILSVLQKGNNNPVVQNLVSLAQNNDTKGLEAFARNMLTEKGLDFDKEFNSFKQSFGVK